MLVNKRSPLSTLVAALIIPLLLPLLVHVRILLKPTVPLQARGLWREPGGRVDQTVQEDGPGFPTSRGRHQEEE